MILKLKNKSRAKTPFSLILFIPAFLFLVTISCSEKALKGIEEQDENTSAVAEFQPEDQLKFDNDPYYVANNVTSSSFGPNTITRNILQDKNGEIWFATFQGIIKYDGKEFINYTNKSLLRKYRIFSILEDSRGSLWFGTIGAGVYHFDHKAFTNYTMENGLGNNKVECMVEDDQGGIWFGHTNGVTKYDGKEFKNYNAESGLEKDVVHSIIKDESGKLWIGSTNAGVTIYDGKTFNVFKKEDGSTFRNVRMIMQDSQGNMWFGGNDGLNRYDGKDLVQMTPNFTGYIFEDTSGMIYCSVNEGGGPSNIILARFDPKKVSTNEWKPEILFSRNEMLFGITEDRSGNIWFGTLGGAYRYDGEKVHDFKE